MSAATIANLDWHPEGFWRLTIGEKNDGDLIHPTSDNDPLPRVFEVFPTMGPICTKAAADRELEHAGWRRTSAWKTERPYACVRRIDGTDPWPEPRATDLEIQAAQINREVPKPAGRNG